MQLQIHYSGTVQGVGFRATTAALAAQHDITGWVRNLADGRVELLIQGQEEDLRSFLKMIEASRLGDLLEKVEIQSHSTDTPQLHGFSIRS